MLIAILFQQAGSSDVVHVRFGRASVAVAVNREAVHHVYERNVLSAASLIFKLMTPSKKMPALILYRKLRFEDF